MNTTQSPAAGDDQAIEREILAKGKTAPRITPARITLMIKSVHYFTGGDGFAGAASLQLPESDEVPVITPPEELDLLTFCVIVLANGFTVTGESACASPENFDAEIGKKIAFENAKQKIWPLEGYALKTALRAAALTDAALIASEG